MGNALGLCTVGDDKQSKKGSLLKEKRILQVIKVDGKILEFKNPVIVRDLLVSYPNFYVGMFNKATQGLPLDHKLKVGKIYYLLPSVVDQYDHLTTSNEKRRQNEGDVVRRETDVTTMKTATATATTTTTTTTIKVVFTKEQLQQILCNKQGSVEELLLGVVAANNNKKVLSSDENCSSSTWLPKLESIPEGTSELVC